MSVGNGFTKASVTSYYWYFENHAPVEVEAEAEIEADEGLGVRVAVWVRLDAALLGLALLGLAGPEARCTAAMAAAVAGSTRSVAPGAGGLAERRCALPWKCVGRAGNGEAEGVGSGREAEALLA
jgi:hypothetical protein